MDVKFISTTSEKLSDLPVVNGQIIALSDISGYYYDMNDTRYTASNIEFVNNLPTSGTANKLYVYENSIYTWNGSKFVLASDAPNDGKFYGKKGGQWATIDNTYTCTNSSDDLANINAIISRYLSSSDIHTAKLSIDGKLSHTVNNPSIQVSRTSNDTIKSIILDFSNCQINANIESGIFIYANNVSQLTVHGLHNASKSNIIDASNVSHLVVDGSSLSDIAGANCSVQITGGCGTIQNCAINLDNVAKGIVANNVTSLNVSHCTFSGANTRGRGIVASCDDNVLNIADNYMPQDCVAWNGTILDPQFSNICPPV